MRFPGVMKLQSVIAFDSGTLFIYNSNKLTNNNLFVFFTYNSISYSSKNDIEPRKERLFPNGRTYNILSGMRLTTTLIDKADPSTIRSGDEPQGHPSEIRSLTSLWSGRHWAKLQEIKITKEGVWLKWRWTLNLTAEETITGTHEEYITNPVTAISL